MKIRILLSLGIAVSLLTSCSDDFLDKFPVNSVEQSNAIRNISDCRQSLVGIYSSLKGYTDQTNKEVKDVNYTRSLVLAPDIQTDIVYSTIGYTNTYGTIYQWQFSSETSEIQDVFSNLYITISRVNFLLDNINNVVVSDANKGELEEIKGQAYFIRALAYSELVKLYAKDYEPATADADLGVPIITNFVSSEPARSTVAQVYAQILSDIKESESKVKLDLADSPNVTVGTVQALKARVCLYMHKWADAKTAATAVIANTKYELLSGNSYKNVWTNDAGNEIIWKVALNVGDLGDALGSNFCANPGAGATPDYVPAQWVLDLYDKKNDVRYESFFKKEVTGLESGLVWEVVYKYPGNDALKAGKPNYQNMPKPFRLSEMYLIRAEAYAALDDVFNANADLNSLRKSRITGYVDVNLTKSELVEQIKTERVKELFMEGHRLVDLKRYKQGFTRVKQEKTNVGPNQNEFAAANIDFRFIWPIPKHEMDANKNMKQNDGY